MFESEGFDLNTITLCAKGEEELEGIAVGLNGIVAHSPDVKEVLIEELREWGTSLGN